MCWIIMCADKNVFQVLFQKVKEHFIQKSEEGLNITLQCKCINQLLKVSMSNLRKHLQVCRLISVEYFCKDNTAGFKHLKMFNRWKHGHKCSICNYNDESSVARHFSSHDNSFSDLHYMGIETVNMPCRGGNRQNLFWTHVLVPLIPSGLNEEFCCVFSC